MTTDNQSNMLVCKVAILKEIKEIASGAFHACVLSDEGKVFSFGSGGKGRLGFGNESGSLVPTVLELKDCAVEEEEFSVVSSKRRLARHG